MGKRYYAVLRGRQPGVYNCRMSAEAQVRAYSNSFHRGFDSLEEAEAWLKRASGRRYPYYEEFHSITRSHRIWPRSDDEPHEADIFFLQCDGASRGNPGPSGCGGIISQPSDDWRYPGARMAHYLKDCGHGTNNAAEYRALNRGLTLALGLGIRNIRVETDSKLVACQSRGEWSTHHPVMAWYRDHAQALLHEFDWWELCHVSRNHNFEADELANAAIDQESRGDVYLYGDVIEDVEDVAARVVRRFSQYNYRARIMIHYTSRVESDEPTWSDDDDSDDDY